LLTGGRGYLPIEHFCVHQRHLPPAFTQSALFVKTEVEPPTDGLADGAEPAEGAETEPPPVLVAPESVAPGLDAPVPVDVLPLPVVPDGVPLLPGAPTPPEVLLPAGPLAPLEPLAPAAPLLPEPAPLPAAPCAAPRAGASATTAINDPRRICFIVLLLVETVAQYPDHRVLRLA
jgi:hypothetical protein